MTPSEKLIDILPVLVAISLLGGIALWWTTDLRRVGSELIREGRYVRLALVTILSALSFLAVFTALSWFFLWLRSN